MRIDWTRRIEEDDMDDTTRGQVIGSAAEVYDTFFLPALFQEWTGKVISAAGIEPGQKVLDVACGTGVLAIPQRKGSARMGPWWVWTSTLECCLWRVERRLPSIGVTGKLRRCLFRITALTPW
jgi:hypothetical protein